MVLNVRTYQKVEVRETDTVGSVGYVVAMLCGGMMECPEMYYSDYQLIFADSEREALDKYNKLNNCSYFYGAIVCKLSEAGFCDDYNYLKYKRNLSGCVDE